MNKKLISLSGLIAGIAILVFFFFQHHGMEKHALEWLLNQNTQDAFHRTVRLEGAHIDSLLQLHIRNLQAEITSKNGAAVPIEMASLDSEGPLWAPLAGIPLTFHWKNLRIARSREPGVHGSLLLQGGLTSWKINVRGQVESLDLQDLVWMDPEHFKGASGKIKGLIAGEGGALVDPSLELRLEIVKPGGKLPASTFDLFRPYLPQSVLETKLNKLSPSSRLIGYNRASFWIKNMSADKMKAEIHILAPDYPLDLNVNMEIRLDEKNAFLELAQIMGLLEVKSS
ncbi:MAG: hypothetical protein EXS63_08140 [Candidatus Omnitrophica bacterium]|nr:hypothetical protein [Candidatus Omnitrophota bacterium]